MDNMLGKQYVYISELLVIVGVVVVVAYLLYRLGLLNFKK